MTPDQLAQLPGFTWTQAGPRVWIGETAPVRVRVEALPNGTQWSVSVSDTRHPRSPPLATISGPDDPVYAVRWMLLAAAEHAATFTAAALRTATRT